MVPVRQGSERLSRKNYLKIGDFTVLEITLVKAIKSKVFDRIVVNTDDPMLEEDGCKVDAEKATEWIKKGAKPSKTVGSLFKKAGVGS